MLTLQEKTDIMVKVSLAFHNRLAASRIAKEEAEAAWEKQLSILSAEFFEMLEEVTKDEIVPGLAELTEEVFGANFAEFHPRSGKDILNFFGSFVPPENVREAREAYKGYEARKLDTTNALIALAENGATSEAIECEFARLTA